MVGGGAPVVPPCVWWLGAWFSNGDTIAFHDDGGRSAKTYSNAKKQILASLPCDFENSNGFQIASHLVGQYMKIPGDPNRSPWLSQCSCSITILFGSCSWLQSLLRLMPSENFNPTKILQLPWNRLDCPPESAITSGPFVEWKTMKNDDFFNGSIGEENVTVLPWSADLDTIIGIIVSYYMLSCVAVYLLSRILQNWLWRFFQVAEW